MRAKGTVYLVSRVSSVQITTSAYSTPGKPTSWAGYIEILAQNMLWEEVGTTRGCDSSELNDRIFVMQSEYAFRFAFTLTFFCFPSFFTAKNCRFPEFHYQFPISLFLNEAVNVFRRRFGLQALLQVYNTMLQHCLIYNNQTTTDLESIAVGETMGMFCRSRPEKRLFMQKSILTGHSLSQSFSTDTPFALRATQSSDCEMFIHSAAKWLCRLSYIKLQVLRHV